MSDGHGFANEEPPGQWTTPGAVPNDVPPPPPGPPPNAPYGPYGQPPYGQPPYSGQGPGGQGPYGGQYGYRPPQALRPGIIPLRPLGLGDILDGTIKFIRSNPKATLGLSALTAALAMVPIAVAQVFLYYSGPAVGPVISDSSSPPTLSQLSESLASSSVSALISIIVEFIAVTVLTGALMPILGRAVFGGRISIAGAWALTRSRVPALFGLALLTALILFVPLILIFLLAAALIVAGDNGAGLGLGALLTLVYIPYGLFFGTRFALAAPALVLEGRGVADAMRRSWRLVSGDFWRVLGILIVTQILTAIVGFVLAIPFGIIGIVSASGTSSIVPVAVVTAIGSTISAMITYPLRAGVSGLLYADRRMRGEAFDLVLHTAAIDQQRLGWVPASADELWHPSNAAGA